MIRSTGTRGSTLPASLPARFIAERIAARSTTAGTPVKSCISTRAGRKGSSESLGGRAGQRERAPTLDSAVVPDSASRTRPSSRIFTVMGSADGSSKPALVSSLSG